MGWRVAVGIFLVLHGLIHLGIYGPPPGPGAPWDTRRSWLFATRSARGRRTMAIVLAGLAAALYLVAGTALLVGGGWWAPVAVVASVVSLILLVGYFHPWLSLGVLIDGAVVWAALSGWPE